MGFQCPERQTTPDFLTSMTSPAERIVRTGFENRVPRTPDEFAIIWKKSETRKQLLENIEDYDRRHPIGGQDLEKFVASRKAQQARGQYGWQSLSSISKALTIFVGASSPPTPCHTPSKSDCACGVVSNDSKATRPSCSPSFLVTQ